MVRLIGVVNRGAALLGAALLLAITLAVFYEVILRYVFNAPTEWSFELTGYALVWAGFLAAGYALAHDRHVRVEILSDRLPGPMRTGLMVITDLIALGFCLAVAYHGFKYVHLSYITESASVSPLRVPMFIPEAGVPIGAVLLSLQFVARILVQLGLARSAEEGT